MALPKLFHVNEDSPAADWAILAVRILAGLTLFVNSGISKLFHLPSLLAVNFDPLHAGALAAPALIYAAFALGICSLLVFVGLATRYAALLTTISLAGTFFLIDHAVPTNLLDPGHNSHPEVIWLYMMTYFFLVFTGPGRFSLDRAFSKSCRKA